ncbi:DUF922 domain-containing protein [Niabella pedocola]|uniref:DUF922 domain-containing protein n=1 Tax=Niabella pedocola TaxID=1752077 RepID=A0ABS8PPA7_9BACT|nr:DUF922 domain-containing protein [Niabella pedocola]MCD2422937.1 DUF922 domain-containing protein [Niabella pedocola]
MKRFLLAAAGLFWAQLIIAQTPVIRWSASRMLRLSDYIIIKPGQESPAALGRNMAVTRTGFVYTMARITSGTNKGKSMIRVYAQMTPSHSYIVAEVAKGSPEDRAYLLNHEQKHFDISEIYARELSRFLRTQSLGKAPMERMTNEMNRLFKELDAYQKKYDAETANGRNKQKQELWNLRIAQRLKALLPYAAKDYILSLPR